MKQPGMKLQINDLAANAFVAGICHKKAVDQTNPPPFSCFAAETTSPWSTSPSHRFPTNLIMDAGLASLNNVKLSEMEAFCDDHMSKMAYSLLSSSGLLPPITEAIIVAAYTTAIPNGKVGDKWNPLI